MTPEQLVAFAKETGIDEMTPTTGGVLQSGYAVQYADNRGIGLRVREIESEEVFSPYPNRFAARRALSESGRPGVVMKAVLIICLVAPTATEEAGNG